MQTHNMQKRRSSLSWAALGYSLVQQLKSSYITQKRWRSLWWIAACISGITLKVTVGFPTDPWVFFYRVLPQIPSMVFRQGPLLKILVGGTVIWGLAVDVPWLVLLGVVCILLIGEWTVWQTWHMRPQRHPAQTESKLVRLMDSSEKEQRLLFFTANETNAPSHEGRAQWSSAIADQDTLPLQAQEQVTSKERPLFEWRGQGAVSGTALHPGYVREDNQDCLFAVTLIVSTQSGLEVRGFYVVADGIGGQVGGKEASARAIKSVLEPVFPAMLRLDSIEDEQAIVLVRESVQYANRTLFDLNRGKAAEEHMGTTLTLALLLGTSLFVANVGDSRTYVYQRRNRSLRQLTVDHSHVAQLVAKGVITREDIYTHPDRNLIYRSLGDQPEIEIDTFQVDVESGDAVLCCSDGVWEMVRDPDIERLLSQHSHPDTIASHLLQAALDGGGEDNISAVVVHIAA